MPELSQPISFRLPAAAARRLAERAGIQGVSCGELAKRLILEALSSESATTDELRELKESINDLHDRLDRHSPTASTAGDDLADLARSVRKLREDIATATAALLVQAGKVTVRDADQWVRRNLLSAR